MSASANSDISHLKGASPESFDHDSVEPDMGHREAVAKVFHTLLSDLVLGCKSVPREGQVVIDFAVVREGSHDQRVVASGVFGPRTRATALIRRV